MAKKKTKKTFLKRLIPSNSPKARLIVFMLVFAAVGTFFLFRTFAAPIAASSNPNCSKSYCYYPLDPKIAYWNNVVRQQNGRSYLPLNECLSGYARNWALHMKQEGHWSHAAEEYGSDWYKAEINKYNCGAWKLLGENVGNLWCTPPKQATEKNLNDCAWNMVIGDGGGTISWMHHASHFNNMIDTRWTTQGVGSFTEDNGMTWIVVEYAQF